MDGKGKSFTRRTLGSTTFVQAVGTKPGLNGTTLVSSGLGDLDNILQSADVLKIAWQYQRYLNEQKALEARRQRQQKITTHSWASAHLHASSLAPSLSSVVASGSLEYTSTFDLRKSMDQATINARDPVCLSLQGGVDLARLQEQCASFVSRHARLLEAQNVGRIALQSLYAPQSMHLCSEWMILSFLAWLKGIVRTTNVVVFVTIPASLLTPSILVRLQHLAEILLSVEAVSDNHKEEAMLLDSHDMSGLLHIHKLASINSQVPFFPEATTYAIKVLRRKEIVLEHLHLAPVDAQSKDSRFAGATTQVGCGTPANAPSSLDF